LTGDRTRIYELIKTRFKLSLMENPQPDPDGRTESISHSDRLALVDRGTVIGLFDSNDSVALETLVAQSRRRAAPAWIRGLPGVNASLNGLCALFLIQGWLFIRGGRRRSQIEVPGASEVAETDTLLAVPTVRSHVICMSLAVFCSILFLTSYLVYHFHVHSVPFGGSGSLRWIYFTVLISHTILATFGVVPLVCLTLLRALRQDFLRHRKIASTTLPIWIYVSITGVVIYLMLYHLPAIHIVIPSSNGP
jgi:protein SCO1/2/putative membrane protein